MNLMLLGVIVVLLFLMGTACTAIAIWGEVVRVRKLKRMLEAAVYEE